jgi:hypothetical protein
MVRLRSKHWPLWLAGAALAGLLLALEGPVAILGKMVWG